MSERCMFYLPLVGVCSALNKCECTPNDPYSCSSFKTREQYIEEKEKSTLRCRELKICRKGEPCKYGLTCDIAGEKGT